MKYKDWSSDFEIGIGAIDDDHKNLFDLIRQLGDQISQGRGPGRISATINALMLYVDEHFEREERFMLRAGYPDFDAHKKQHNMFRDSVVALQSFHTENPEDVDAQKIVLFLEEWLLHHILEIDVQYKPYLTGEKAGNPDLLAKAKDTVKTHNVQISCPADQENYVKHFMTLISEGSEEGVLVKAAVEKITNVQKTRRKTKAKQLFGK